MRSLLIIISLSVAIGIYAFIAPVTPSQLQGRARWPYRAQKIVCAILCIIALDYFTRFVIDPNWPSR